MRLNLLPTSSFFQWMILLTCYVGFTSTGTKFYDDGNRKLTSVAPSSSSGNKHDQNQYEKVAQSGDMEQKIIKNVMAEYDWRVRPRGLNYSANKETGGPVVVTVNLYMRSISKIDDVNMEYSAQFTFREGWVDPRLAYRRYTEQGDHVADEDIKPQFVVLTTTDTSQQIWMPDTFFQNEKQAQKHMIDKPNVLIRIYPNGKILYSVRLSLVLSCPMHLEFYPLDRQECLIDLASYAYTTDDILYEWKPENPIQRKDGLRKSLPSFDLQDILTGLCTSTTATGTYSCLRTELVLRREFSYYLLQLYIPSFMLVIVSWVSFWLDKDSVPARVTLGVTTLLTMTTQSSGINAKLPPVSYTKAIDIWIGVCLAFIFGALLEFALVNYAARKDIMEKSARRTRRRHCEVEDGYDADTTGTFAMNPLLHQQSSHLRMDSTTVINNNATVDSPLFGPTKGHPPRYGSHVIVANPTRRHKNQSLLLKFWRTYWSKYDERSKRIDMIARTTFPLGFFIFNCIYWTVYMI